MPPAELDVARGQRWCVARVPEHEINRDPAGIYLGWPCSMPADENDSYVAGATDTCRATACASLS